MPFSFYWHDYETFGTDPRRDRPAQFAGLRTTIDLDPIGAPLSVFCRPTRDVLPHPVACLLTGITPQQALRVGLIESEFAARIHEQLAAPGTCGVGFNSLRFDDEFTRHLLYRNFYDAYAREWENGNSRWDIIDLVRLCYALRPDGIVWPRRADGAPSFRLQDLTAANGLAHEHAHDARSDVDATLALARLLRVRQPRLFEFYLALRRKQRAFELLDYAHQTPVLHISSRYPAERGCLAMVVPLAQHPSQTNAIIVYDLSVDPAPLLELDADEIADRVFTPRGDLPDDVERIPLKAVHANRSPALAPLSTLAGVDTARIGLDPALCQEHLRRMRAATDLAEKVRGVFGAGSDERAAIDPELALYRAFPSDADRRLLREVRQTPPEQLAARAFHFRDPRYVELLFRYRARNFPATLDAAESARWDDFCHAKLAGRTDLTTLTLTDFHAEIARLRSTPELLNGKVPLLDALEQWGRDLS